MWLPWTGRIISIFPLSKSWCNVNLRPTSLLMHADLMIAFSIELSSSRWFLCKQIDERANRCYKTLISISTCYLTTHVWTITLEILERSGESVQVVSSGLFDCHFQDRQNTINVDSRFEYWMLSNDAVPDMNRQVICGMTPHFVKSKILYRCMSTAVALHLLSNMKLERLTSRNNKLDTTGKPGLCCRAADLQVLWFTAQTTSFQASCFLLIPLTRNSPPITTTLFLRIGSPK